MPGIGTEISRVSNIIFVSVQYRLGAFGLLHTQNPFSTVLMDRSALGFLSTEDANAPGNYGLGDLKVALRWIRQSIEGFGGDPDKITVMGQGTGSMLVSAMMLDPDIRSTSANFNRLHPRYDSISLAQA